jgi:hypothetical protein
MGGFATMVHDLAEWIRCQRPRFQSERVWPVEDSLPEPILERLAALEQAEQRRSGELAKERQRKRDPAGNAS